MNNVKTDISIDAVTDRDLLRIIEDYGLLERFQNRELNCPSCNKIINFDNVGALKAIDDNIIIFCDDNVCIAEALKG